MSDPVHEPTPSDTPAAALGPAWDLLDALPPAAAAPSMTSTTVEMAAARPRTRPGSWHRAWLGPMAVVVTAFVVGMVAGRATVTDPDQVVFDHLPVFEHYDVVREAGSIDFLREVARRNYPPPRRPPFGRGGDRGSDRAGDRGGEGSPPAYEALDAAVAAFTTATFGADAGSVVERRAAWAARPADEQRRLSDTAIDFQRLSSAHRRELVRLARTLGGRDGAAPDHDELLDAARLWHQWLATRDPAERQGVIDLDTADRLEWLDHYALAGPGAGRGGPFREGGGFRGFPPPGPPPGGPRPEGPRFNGRPPEGGRPPWDSRRGPLPRPETPGPPR